MMCQGASRGSLYADKVLSRRTGDRREREKGSDGAVTSEAGRKLKVDDERKRNLKEEWQRRDSKRNADRAKEESE